MNGVAPAAPSSPAASGPVDFDALYVDFQARATGLASASAKLAATDALLAEVVASGINAAVFKPLAGAMGKAAGLDPTSLLKQMVEARGIISGSTTPAGGARPPSGMQNPEPAPSPEPLNAVLHHIARAVVRQVVCGPHVVTACALWAACTYGAQRAHVFPRLVCTSPTKRCGKSTLLGLIRATASTPAKFDNVSASSAFRLIEARRPTLLIDEVDAFFAANEELRGVVNAGYERTGSVLRCVPTPDGKGFTEAEFMVFCPIALAGIGGLPDTVLDRSIVCTLARAPARGTVVRRRAMRHRELEAFRALIAAQLVAHADAIGRAMEAGTTVIPRELSDRAQDNWEPLLALADLAGGEWPARARAAAVALSGMADQQSHKEMLLSDLQGIVGGTRRDAVQAYATWRASGRVGARPGIARHVRSGLIVTELLKMEHRPWPEYGEDGKGMTPVRLARMLRPFQVAPMDHRMPVAAPSMIPGKPPAKTEVVKVYSVAALRTVIRHYL